METTTSVEQNDLLSDTSLDLWDPEICERLDNATVRNRLRDLRHGSSVDTEVENLAEFTHKVIAGTCLNASGAMQDFAIASPTKCLSAANRLYEFLDNCRLVLDGLSETGSDETVGFINPQRLSRDFREKLIDFMTVVSVLRDETLEFTGTDWLRIKEQARALQNYIEGEPQKYVDTFKSSWQSPA